MVQLLRDAAGGVDVGVEAEFAQGFDVADDHLLTAGDPARGPEDVENSRHAARQPPAFMPYSWDLIRRGGEQGQSRR